MSNFRTTFTISPSDTKIDYNNNTMLFGSCFSENIGDKFSYYKFNNITNPFGVLYNPASIANSINILLNKKKFTETDIFKHNNLWNSFYHHSNFSNKDKYAFLQNINNNIIKASDYLSKCNFLIITFGTSWVYEYKNTNKIVSNCHKIPSKEFNRYKLTTEQITTQYVNIIKLLKAQNKDINIIFTVSPIRHIKDGAEQNQLSKSTLIIAIHNLVEMFENITYFPSYEIMIDDLRDYRFYNNDMIHPSDIAIEYIWNKFTDTYINPNTTRLMVDIKKINQALQHRPFQPENETYQSFLRKTKDKINGIIKKHKNINFNDEINNINNKIS